MADTNLSKLVESALSNLKTMTEADTIIGKPLEVSGGSTIIPVSKITVGFTSGGVDYTSKANPEKDGNMRDHATIEQLLVLSNLENINALFIGQGMPQPKRIEALNALAKSQIEAITRTNSLMSLRALSDAGRILK